jgi:hypothetical protein
MGVTPGVADSLFGPDLRLVLGLIVVLSGHPVSNSCAVPNVYQRDLVSFVFDLGTQGELIIVGAVLK